MGVDGCGPFQNGKNRKKNDDRARVEDLPLQVAAIGLMGTHRGLMRGDAIPLASLTSGYRSCGRDTRGVASLQREETAAPQNRSDRVFWAVKCRGKLRTSGGSSSAGRAPVCCTGCRGFNPRLPPHPYEPAELQKLFASMDEEETVRYKFFLGTACREQEVMYAAWPDIDFARGIYNIRAKPDVGFTPKKHESRDVKMPTELVEMLRKRKKHAPHQRWIFING